MVIPVGMKQRKAGVNHLARLVQYPEERTVISWSISGKQRSQILCVVFKLVSVSLELAAVTSRGIP